jgi:hypothetical protein
MNAGEDLDERRLARAVLAEQRDDFAAPDGHADVTESLGPAEALGDAIDPKHRRRYALQCLITS